MNTTMDNVKVKKIENTAIITLEKKGTLNALSEDFITEINQALDHIESSPDIFTIIITGYDNVFVSGGDVNEMYGMNRDEIFQWSALGSSLNMRLQKMQLPVIAAINGYALGGGLELAMSCDIRIAADKVKMGLPEVNLGVISGAGGTQRLPALVGEGIAKEMIFTGKIIEAGEALRIGLVNYVVSADKLMDEAFELARTINSKAQLAVRAAKETVTFAGSAGIEKGCLIERQKFSELFETEDQKIGMGGFLRKEKVTFRNR